MGCSRSSDRAAAIDYSHGSCQRGGGTGPPPAPHPQEEGKRPPSSGTLFCHSEVSTALFEQRVVFLACKATAAGGQDKQLGCLVPKAVRREALGAPGGQRGLGASSPALPPEPGTWLLGLRIPRGGRSWKSRSSGFRLPAALQRALKVLRRREREGAGDEAQLRGGRCLQP